MKIAVFFYDFFNIGNYLHLKFVVHYKTVRSNNVFSVNYSFNSILLNGCHLIGTIKPSLHPPEYYLWKLHVWSWTGRRGSRGPAPEGSSHYRFSTSTIHKADLCAFHQPGTVNENVLESNFEPLCDGTTRLADVGGGGGGNVDCYSDWKWGGVGWGGVLSLKLTLHTVIIINTLNI